MSQSVAQLKRKRTENPSQRDPCKSHFQGLWLCVTWDYTIWIRIKTESNLTAIKAVKDTHHGIHLVPVIPHSIPHHLSFLVCKIQTDPRYLETPISTIGKYRFPNTRFAPCLHNKEMTVKVFKSRNQLRYLLDLQGFLSVQKDDLSYEYQSRQQGSRQLA